MATGVAKLCGGMADANENESLPPDESRKARPEQPTGRDEVSRITNGPQAHRADARASSKSREPTSAMAVNEPGLDSSADGEGEEGIDRSLKRTATPKHLAE